MTTSREPGDGTEMTIRPETRTSPSLAVALAVATAALLPGVAHGRDFFTIAVIPDTQEYVDSTKPQRKSLSTFLAETTFLAEHKEDLALAFVTHVGDVVQHGDGTNGTPGDRSWGAGDEWDRAAFAMDVLAASRVPFGMSPGNHDYDSHAYEANARPLHGSVMWRRYFGPASPYFAGKSWYGGASMGLHDPGLSSYQVFSAAGRGFLHISLEMEPGDAALAWAQKVIDGHKGWATIVTTHAFLNPPADGDPSPPLEVPAQRIPASYRTGSPGGWNGAQEVWEKLIVKNDQIFMVLCGHAWNPTVNQVSVAENLRIGLNDAGHPVYQVLTDYQGNTKASAGGDGWLRLMEFDLQRQTIHFTTYSPVLHRRAGQGGEWTFNQPPRFSDFTLPIPPQVLTTGSRRTGQAR
jgi:hypothetical protein